MQIPPHVKIMYQQVSNVETSTDLKQNRFDRLMQNANCSSLINELTTRPHSFPCLESEEPVFIGIRILPTQSQTKGNNTINGGNGGTYKIILVILTDN